MPTHGKAQEYGAKTPIDANLQGNVARRPVGREVGSDVANPASNPLGAAAFLLSIGLDGVELAQSIGLARRWGVPVHQVLLSTGQMTAEEYVAAVAVYLRLPVLDASFKFEARAQDPNCPVWLSAVRAGAMQAWLIDATAADVDVIESYLRRLPRDGRPVWVAAAYLIARETERQRARACLREARFGLRGRSPELSAATGLRWWQRIALFLLMALGCGAASIEPQATAAALAAILAIPFLGVSILRTLALLGALRQPPPRSWNAETWRRWDNTLPVYSIIVPLFEEPEVLPDLIWALRTLDYPAAKLDIMIVLEAVDRVTPRRLAGLELPSTFRVITVPDAAPRTKPKAANYALQFARGDYVVVYDAEDRPEPDQLRAAIAAFARAGKRVACVQARLNVYNAYHCWLSRQFAIEYSSLFDAVLPALMRLGVPVPLGGTSNHFPRHVLQEIGAWDPYNVTEDADLGVRLARRGWTTAVIESTTWEEAPVTLGVWFRQRTRWMKGWMQTYLVHTRHPWRLWRELGFGGTIGFHALTGGLILSALVHPVFCATLLIGGTDWLLTAPAVDEASDWTIALWWIAWINLLFGYVASILLGVVALIQRRAWWLLPATLAMPLYWLLISAAAYRAVYQFAIDPFRWEKTPHGQTSMDDDEA